MVVTFLGSTLTLSPILILLLFLHRLPLEEYADLLPSDRTGKTMP